jgi:Arc/MetJ-type ribon-helix-helix transcriptional regulator
MMQWWHIRCKWWKKVGMKSIPLGMKFSGNIPADDLEFLDQQVAAGKYRSRSAALTKAVRMLREADMHDAYIEAFADIDPIWDTVTADGLEDESW